MRATLNSEEYRKLHKHTSIIQRLNMIKFADGLKIRSKCGWYEHGEHHGERLLKPRRKGWPPKSKVEMERESNNWTQKISNNIKAFYETLFKKTLQKLMSKNKNSLFDIHIQDFLSFILKKFGFGKSFITGIDILLKK